MSLSIHEIERLCEVSQRRADERRTRAARRWRRRRAVLVVLQLIGLLAIVAAIGYVAGQVLS